MNIKPVVPGHVLVSPERVVRSFEELTPEEVADLWYEQRDLLIPRPAICSSIAVSYCAGY